MARSAIGQDYGSAAEPAAHKRAARDVALLALPGALLTGLLLRLWLSARSQWMIDGDEALFGIGALRLPHGDLPNLLYGVPYMGMLQSYVAAPLIAAFGPTPEALRGATFLSSIAYIAVTWRLARVWYGPAVAAVAALFAAVPSVYFDAVSLKVWGSYLDIMVLGSVLLLGAWHCRRVQGKMSRRRWLLLGLITGLALWADFLVAYYLVTALLLLPWRAARRWLPRALLYGTLGLIVGGAPLWWYNLRRPGATFRWLFAGVAQPGGSTSTEAVAHVLLSTLVPRVAGLTSPWSGLPGAITVPLAVLLALSLLLALDDAFRQWRGRRRPRPAPSSAAPLLLFLAVSVAVYLLSGFGRPSLSPFDGSGRYLLPLWTPLPILAAALCVRVGIIWRPAGILAVLLVLSANLAGHLASNPRLVFQSPYWDHLPMDTDSDALLRWLGGHHVDAVWVNHWAGDPLMYLSGNSIRAADYYDIVVGHGLNRFPGVFQSVEAAPQAAFVLVVPGPARPGMAARLHALGVAYRHVTIGPYDVYLPTSRRVDPAEVAAQLRYPY